MVISEIQQRLRSYREVRYRSEGGCLTIPALTPHGFQVQVREVPGQYTVAFEGWHEEFSDSEQALRCVAFGLSRACRLRVYRCFGLDCKWQVPSQVNGEWQMDSEVGLLLPTIFLPKATRVLFNDIGELAPGRA